MEDRKIDQEMPKEMEDMIKKLIEEVEPQKLHPVLKSKKIRETLEQTYGGDWGCFNYNQGGGSFNKTNGTYLEVKFQGKIYVVWQSSKIIEDQ